MQAYNHKVDDALVSLILCFAHLEKDESEEKEDKTIQGYKYSAGDELRLWKINIHFDLIF